MIWLRLDRNAVRKVIGLLKQSAAEELAIQDGDLYVRVKRQPGSAAAAPGAGPAEEATEATTRPAAASRGSYMQVVRAGLVGLFHRGRGPDAEPLVEVGDRVTEGQVVGTIEALRKLTDVVSELEGEVVEVLEEDGEPVEYGQPLFSIRVKRGEG